jgi:hypothetical protein
MSLQAFLFLTQFEYGTSALSIDNDIRTLDTLKCFFDKFVFPLIKATAEAAASLENFL